MRIVVAHNYYQQAGGEDQVFRTEVELLRRNGHEVTTLVRHNDDIESMGRLKLAAATLWNRATYRSMRALCENGRVNVVHFHNTFPLISPAAYYGARAGGAAVVQTLHNYRLICPAGLLFREGRVCEDCVGKAFPWPGVMHSCYKQSLSATAVTASMLGLHRLLQTWQRKVDAFIALSDSARDKFRRSGVPLEKVVVKGNCLADTPEVGNGGGGYALFVGRLTREKGIHTVLDAWSRLTDVPRLVVIGDGPDREAVREAAERSPLVTWRGSQSSEEVMRAMGEAAFLVVPSEWYEPFGRVIVESFAKGTPVLASRLGAVAELVDDGRTGLHFTPGDADDLAQKARALMADPERLAAMRVAARTEFEEKHSAQKNYEILMKVYAKALATRNAKPVVGESVRPEHTTL